MVGTGIYVPIGAIAGYAVLSHPQPMPSISVRDSGPHWRQTNMLKCSSPEELGIDGNDHRAKRHQHGADRR